MKKTCYRDTASFFDLARQQLLRISGIEETRKPRITTYLIGSSGICHLRTMEHGIDFRFLKGAKMHDPSGQLHGSGKKMRILSLSEYDADLVQGYLDQAARLAGH